jgi:predicted transcriptional regulator
MSEENSMEPVELATELTIAWLNNPNNRASADDIPGFLRTMHATLTELASGVSAAADEPETAEHVPAVSVRRSLASKDHILSLIDGKPYKTLTRHLSTKGLTPAEYRQRYGLKADYPMVAESYAAHRRELAKRIGLGRRPTSPAEAAAPEPKAKTAPKPKAKLSIASSTPRARKAKAVDSTETKPAE